MNIFKLKFQLHRTINLLFYAIIFSLGFLCGNGTLKLKNLFFMNAKALTVGNYISDIDCFSFNRDKSDTYFMLNDKKYYLTNGRSGEVELFNLYKATNGFDTEYLSYSVPFGANAYYNGEYWYPIHMVFNGRLNFATGTTYNNSSEPIYVGSESTFITAINENYYHYFYILLSRDSDKAFIYGSKSGTNQQRLYVGSSSIISGFTLLNYYIENEVQEPRYYRRWSTGSPNFTQLVKDYTNFYSTFDFPYCKLDPEFNYAIQDGSDYGKRINMQFLNFTDNMYVKIEDVYNGNTILLNDFPNRTDYVLNNISFDALYYVSIYKNEELWNVYTIDVANELNIKGKNRFVNFALVEETDNPRFVFSFENTKDGDICYIDYQNEVETVDCQEQYMYTVKDGDIRFNSRAEFYVMNKGNEVYRKGYTVNLLKDLPMLYFDSSVNSEDGSNVVNIIAKNVLNSDIVSYSYDNITYIDFPSQRLNTLVFFNNSPLYVKITRSGNIVATGYFYVNIDKFNNSSIENYNNYSGTGVFKLFKDLTSNIDFSLLNNFSSVWTSLRNSKLYLILNLLFIGSLCVFIIKALRR